jgi:serine protease
MKSLLSALAAAVLALPVSAQSPAESEARVIVRFKPQADSVRAKALSLRATRLEAREIAQTRATALGMRTGHALRAGLSLDERTHVVMARGMSAAQLVKRLAADAEVELVAVDGRRKRMAVPNDPLFGGEAPATTSYIGQFLDAGDPTTTPPTPPQLRDTYSRSIDQWYLKAPTASVSATTGSGDVVSSVNAPGAWSLTAGLSSTTIVAVLDTGVRLDHPDLAGQLVAGYDMIGYGSPGNTSTAIANDGGGHDSDPSDPGDWVSSSDVAGGTLGSGCDSSDVANSSWHGTRVSGIVAAKANNGQGLAGVGWSGSGQTGLLKVLPVRVLGKCGGYDSDIIAGMRWAAGLSLPGVPANTNRAKVLNLSLGGSGSCGTTGTGALYREAITAINATGATIVVAAGNSAGQAVGLPGNCPGVISVAALRHVGTKVGFSSVGADVTIAAPGGNCVNLATGYPCLYPMVSTTNRGTTSPIANDEGYTNSNASVGTSFSAPVVSGIVGLMAAVRPSLTSTEATQILKATARPFPTSGGSAGTLACVAPGAAEQLECYCTTSTCGAGMVDAAAAVAAAKALNGTTVAIGQSPASGLTAGQTLTLTATPSGLPSGRTVASTAWVITDNGGIVSAFASGASTATATITPTGAGSFTVRADVTDNLGFVYSQTATVSVAAAPVTPTPTPTPTPTSSGGGGGGGSASLAWLASLLLAAFSLRKRPMRPAPQCRP